MYDPTAAPKGPEGDPFAYMRRRVLRRPAAIPTAAATQPRPALVDPREMPDRALAMLGLRPTLPVSPMTRLRLSDGAPCALPIRYFDARAWIAVFPVTWATAASLLDAQRLEPAGNAEGLAEAWLGGFAYADSDLGPYDEVALGIPAMAPGDPEASLYVLDLPVSTAAADLAGREIWGYPKFVGTIAIESDARSLAIRLDDAEGGRVLTFAGALRPAEAAPTGDIWTLSIRHGRRLRTRLQIVTPFTHGPGGGCTLDVGASRHPMAARLRTLGLDGARPREVRSAAPFQALLFAGKDKGAA